MTSGLESVQVLIVDDNPSMRAIVATILFGCGIRRLREEGDGSAALGALRDFTPDLAVVDYQMAPMDGVAFTRFVRNDPASPAPFMPVIMMTGHTERSKVLAARDAGVTEFVAKPLTALSLLRRIEAVIQRPRPFIRTCAFFGPDRRRRQDPDHEGPWRREGDQARLAAGEGPASAGAGGSGAAG